jgi:CheY-like chemotaxis protein
VQDSGAGLPERNLPHVFDRFVQEDGSLTRKHGGLGLGLAIVRQIVELHGGSVDVSSPGENEGSTFTVVLPGVATRRKPGLVAADQENKLPRLEGVRVLVLDDRSDDRELLAVILRGQDAEVRLAASAADGLEVLRSWKPDVLVSDIEMPDEDGYTFLRKVRDMADPLVAAIPAIAVTAHARMEDRQRAIGAGYEYHISKPIDRMRLIDAVGAAAGRKNERLKSPARGTLI